MSMFGWGPATKIYLAAGATDMRKGFDGLYALVRDRLELEPLSGHVFLFSNAQRNRMKLIYWDGSGLWVCAKRLERGCFRWPAARGRADEDRAQPRRNGVAGGRDRLGGKPASSVVSEDRRRREAAKRENPLANKT